MTTSTLETSEGFRKARGKLAIVAALSIAWAAAQIELKAFSLGGISTNITSGNTIFFGLLILLLYFGGRTTLEFGMQPKEVRRWRLAQIDFHISYILFRISLFVLAISIVARDQNVTLKALSGFAIFFVLFLVIFSIVYFLLCVVYIPMGGSVANSAILAMGYSMAITFFMMVLIIIDQVHGIELLSFMPRFIPPTISAIHTVFLLFVFLLLFVSFFRSDILLNPLFAFVPKRVGREYTKDGKKYYEEDWNPEHPDYESLKSSSRFSGPLIMQEVANDEQDSEKKLDL